MLANSKERETTGAIAVLEDVSGLQDQRPAKKFNQEPAPQAVAQSCFLSLFPNRVQAILRPQGCKTWTTVSKHWRLSDEQILKAVSGKDATVWGARFDWQTRFGVLDIDPESKYQSVQELAKLTEKLAGVSLTATPYQSSSRGGWHVYLFLDDWQNSKEVEETLKAWLRANGYEIRNGQLEIYPCGRGLRLPLQAGFAWLNSDGSIKTRREELTTNEAISQFVAGLETRGSNWPKAKKLITTQLEEIDRQNLDSVQEREERLNIEGFEGFFNYRLITEKYEEGRQYWQTGLTAKGQRHDAILFVEHYLWHGDESAGVPALPAAQNDEARYRLIRAWLESKHYGYCNHINRGNWRKVEAQIRRAVKWRRTSGAVQVRTPYLMTDRLIERLIALSRGSCRTWTVEDLKKGNEDREAEAREKIGAAVQLLIDQGRKVTGRQIMRLTGCSYHTVKRHLDIWKISPVVALPRAAGEENSFLDLNLIGSGGTRALGFEEKDLYPSAVGADSGDLVTLQEIDVADQRVDFEMVAEPEQPCELAPIVLEPPFLLPGFEPTSELPASRPSPAGCCASLDAGALVRWYSGRAADVAGGSEPLNLSGLPVWRGRPELFVISQTYKEAEKQTELLAGEIIFDQAGLMACDWGYSSANFLPVIIGVHSSSVGLSGFLRNPQELILGAWIVCTRLLVKGLRTLENKGARAPPL